MRAIIDIFLNKFISRKLLVFLLVTIALFYNKVSGEEWINVAMIYIGTQAVIDSIIKLRNK